MKFNFDVNCDLGEGMANDKALMALIDSCNIACGGHAGDAQTMNESVQLAATHKVKIGAHPSFVDKFNFGRKVLNVDPAKLRDDVQEQVSALVEIAKKTNQVLHHVKAHGALYNLTAVSEPHAELMIDLMKGLGAPALLFVPAFSILEKRAKEEGLPVWIEAFADRNYGEDFRLLPRSEQRALLHDPDEIKERVEFMYRHQCLISAKGKKGKTRIDTYCLHGDHPNALENAKQLRRLKNSLR